MWHLVSSSFDTTAVWSNSEVSSLISVPQNVWKQTTVAICPAVKEQMSIKVSAVYTDSMSKKLSEHRHLMFSRSGDNRK